MMAKPTKSPELYYHDYDPVFNRMLLSHAAFFWNQI